MIGGSGSVPVPLWANRGSGTPWKQTQNRNTSMTEWHEGGVDPILLGSWWGTCTPLQAHQCTLTKLFACIMSKSSFFNYKMLLVDSVVHGRAGLRLQSPQTHITIWDVTREGVGLPWRKGQQLLLGSYVWKLCSHKMVKEVERIEVGKRMCIYIYTHTHTLKLVVWQFTQFTHTDLVNYLVWLFLC